MMLFEHEPTLMPFQDCPFNNDHFVAKEFLKLKDEFKIDKIVELGTCVGGSTKWMAQNFLEVHTIEIQKPFQDIAKLRCEGMAVNFHLGSTVDVLAGVLAQPGTGRVLCFIDSHWGDHFPLFDELKIIKESGLKPVIVVHDCMVPDEPAMGYDSYKGVAISFETMKPYIDDIYGEEGYSYHFNSDKASTEIKRGLIYIYPKTNA